MYIALFTLVGFFRGRYIFRGRKVVLVCCTFLECSAHNLPALAIMGKVARKLVMPVTRGGLSSFVNHSPVASPFPSPPLPGNTHHDEMTGAGRTRSVADEGVSKGVNNTPSKNNMDDSAFLATSWGPLLHELQAVIESSPKVTINFCFLFFQGGGLLFLFRHASRSTRRWRSQR